MGHSLSPLIYNKTFAKLGINAVYVPFRVPRGELAAFLKAFERLPVRGYSVTIPHKEVAAGLANLRDDAVTRVQAANTLVRLEAGGWSAYNTDAAAAHASIMASLPKPAGGSAPSLHSRSVLLLGAGGVAKAIAAVLSKEVGVMAIASRTMEKAHHLAEQVDCKAVDWAARHNILADFVINCTPVGMHPNTDESPIHHSFLKPGIMVMDTIYTPETTMLVKEARSRGCHVLTGVDMFVRQAVMQFKLFTGLEPPADFMRDVIKRALSPVVIREQAQETDGAP